MLELDGPTDALLAAASARRHLGTPEGLLARIVAPTPTGIVLWQLWAPPPHASATPATRATPKRSVSRASPSS